MFSRISYRKDTDHIRGKIRGNSVGDHRSLHILQMPLLDQLLRQLRANGGQV